MQSQSSNSAQIEVDYDEQDRIFSHLTEESKSKHEKSYDKNDHTKDMSGQAAQEETLPTQILISQVSKFAQESNLKAGAITQRDLTVVNQTT